MAEELLDDVEKECMSAFGYSFRYINALNETFENVHKTVHYYADHLTGSTDERAKIIRMAQKTDEILMDFAEVYFLSDRYIMLAKEKVLLKKEPKVEKKELDEFHGKLAKVEKEVHAMIRDIRECIQKNAF